jgi:uncharacterized protein (UPF0335 family)
MTESNGQDPTLTALLTLVEKMDSLIEKVELLEERVANLSADFGDGFEIDS